MGEFADRCDPAAGEERQVEEFTQVAPLWNQSPSPPNVHRDLVGYRPDLQVPVKGGDSVASGSSGAG